MLRFKVVCQDKASEVFDIKEYGVENPNLTDNFSVPKTSKTKFEDLV